jgi:hypothetical protein
MVPPLSLADSTSPMAVTPWICKKGIQKKQIQKQKEEESSPCCRPDLKFVASTTWTSALTVVPPVFNTRLHNPCLPPSPKMVFELAIEPAPLPISSISSQRPTVLYFILFLLNLA